MTQEEFAALQALPPEEQIAAISAIETARDTATTERDTLNGTIATLTTERDTARTELATAQDGQGADVTALQNRVATAQTALQVAETARQTAETAVNEERTRSTALGSRTNNLTLELRALSAAGELQLSLDHSALTMAIKAGIFADVKFDDKGEPVGLKEALTNVVQQNPYLVKRRGGAPILGGGDNGRDSGLDTPEAKKAAANMARGF